MWTVNNVILWQYDKKNAKNGPMSKNQEKTWNLVVSKPENQNLTRKTAKKIQEKEEEEDAFFLCWHSAASWPN